jgi:hypothetical protein
MIGEVLFNSKYSDDDKAEDEDITVDNSSTALAIS